MMAGVLSTSVSADRMLLAENGATKYSIVIPQAGGEAEEYAARELQHFLGEITGADFSVVRDSVPETPYEIVLGETNRLQWDDIPAKLLPSAFEGFVILRKDQKLHIAGRFPRATLYGVYEFLETDLGVRFLAEDMTYTPQVIKLTCNPKSRKFDPELEYRNIMLVDHTWALRNRINVTWDTIPKGNLFGGISFVGPSFVHTFSYLIPVEEYFDTHPEYFSMIKGKRIKDMTQLCLTNPDVLRLSIDKVRQWVKDAGYNASSKYLVSISPNDYGNLCECPECAAIDKAEGTKAGTLIRFINKIADVMAREYPNVAVETLAYNDYEVPPKLTKPAPNVVIRFAPIASDFARRIDDPTSEKNKRVYANISNWAKICNYLYVWNYYTNFWDYFDPFPDIRNIDHNIRVFRDKGMKGLFAQTTQTPGGEMRDLRNYLLAKCMWRPETDGKKTVAEFCKLYYGKASGERVIKYINLLHSEFLKLDKPLPCGTIPDAAGFWSDEFIAKANAILTDAESKAETPEEKSRVAVVRLPIWDKMLKHAFGREGLVAQLPVEWRFKTDPANAGLDEQWAAAKSLDKWANIRTDKSWTEQGWDYHGAAWYATKISTPAQESSTGVKYALFFGGVDGTFDVFVDGIKVGEQKLPVVATWNECLFMPIGILTAGEHDLVIRVEKDSWAAGIARPVFLVDLSKPISKELAEAGKRFIDVSRKAGCTTNSEYYGPPGYKFENIVYPRIETFLEHPVKD